MLRFLGFLAALVLILTGILAGGCSIVFTPMLFDGGEFGGSGILPVWLGGLVLGGLGLWLGIWIIRALRRTEDAGTGLGTGGPDGGGPGASD